MTNNIIAIDGPAGSGKSTVARAVADALDWAYLDTGAMYRAVTSEALVQGVDIHDASGVAEVANDSIIRTSPRVSVNGRDVEEDIRSERVNVAVSVVAANPMVREVMVRCQRELATSEHRGIVVEGRDIGTVVFPRATLKIFLTASLEERERRRDDEAAGSVARRDQADSSREASPLRQADDAVVLDTTGRSIEDIVGEVMECLKTISSK